MITVSIVTYKNDFNEVKTCLSNFIDSEEILKVAICENSETPILSEDLLADFSKKIVYISNTKNNGYGAGHNLAYSTVKQLNADYHVVMNLDVFADINVFIQLEKLLSENRNIVHAMPKIISPNGEIQRNCKKLPSPANLFFRRFFTNFSITKKCDDKYTLKDYDYSFTLNAPYLSGCFMFLRKETFEAISGFDERFFMYPEDIDLTRRLHKIGQTVCYPYCSISHEHGRASYKSLKMTFIHIIGMIKYFNKWGWLIDNEKKRFNKNVDYRIKHNGLKDN